MKNQNALAPTPRTAGRISIMALAVSAALAAGAAQAQSGITDLGALGGTVSRAQGVSADGAVVVGYAATSGGSPLHAFRWTESGGMTDLGTLGGTNSFAWGISADGAVVVGHAETTGGATERAFRWTQAGGMIDLGTLGGTSSYAYEVSADGAVVVGDAKTGDGADHAFRWTQAGGMADLGTLGGTDSSGNGVSADGAVVVGEALTTGNAAWRAFRWTQAGGMVDLGTLGGTSSYANGVSADGAVVVGGARAGQNTHAFRWTQAGGMADLGTLGGTHSTANGVSADGAVVVGGAYLSGNALQRAFRWTQAGGMQSVEDWLRGAGVTVASDITYVATGTSADGSVVVGSLVGGGSAFIARVAGVGSGLVTLDELQQSLGAAASGGGMALSAPGTVLNGAHSRPLARRVAAGQKAVWLAGDWGRDDHGPRSGELGLAEVGFGQHLGPLQLNLSLGQTWAQQNLSLNGRAKSDGNYLVAEALLPVAGTLWATAGAYAHWGRTDLRRGYLNAGAPDASSGRPEAATWGLRARLDWENVRRVASADFSPYVDLTYSEARLAAYTESGGGFPAQFNARKDKVSELRLGLTAEAPLAGATRLVGLAEAAHRFERNAARTSGQVLGLFAFDLAGPANRRDWLRAGVGIEGKIGEGRGSVMLNATTQGEALNYWLAAGWQKTF